MLVLLGICVELAGHVPFEGRIQSLPCAIKHTGPQKNKWGQVGSPSSGVLEQLQKTILLLCGNIKELFRCLGDHPELCMG